MTGVELIAEERRIEADLLEVRIAIRACEADYWSLARDIKVGAKQ